MKLRLQVFLMASFSFLACMQPSIQKQNENKVSKSNQITMQDENLVKPVKKLIEAMEAEDAKLIRAQFATTATQAYGADGKMKTAEETAKWLESDIISRQGKVKSPEYTIQDGNQVVVKGQYSSRGYTNKADFLFTVENGLITSWRMRY
ncbi:nuclear transport factor 2 family protein [Belliella sp. DSM 107340]|uniref:Nuclear transport factor 2 family protein n=1 Tax=Belliella calami TaxID=2923436 RepID=A0ABS9UN13_9BACT|nr:nuclear transport factor 2 family protein [Belliella calami]MCH7397673.1 nuclear transport factor 2 family protein [Belliella calami]